ncbi:MAG: ABC transporter ATP-binding protein [Candidatus Paceibacterota bacterium]
MREHWVSFSLIFIGYLVGVVLNDIIQPLLFREIIDALSSGGDRDVIYAEVITLAFFIVGLVVLYNIGFRTGDYANAYFQSRVMERLYNFTFNRLLEHSYRFFSNNFSGSIVAKSKRFKRSFESLVDVISFQIWFSFVSLVGVVIVLFLNVPTLAWMFLVWAIAYLIVTFFLIRKKIVYDLLEAEADSLVTARLSDAILNILNIKIFGGERKEKLGFQAVTKDEETRRRRAWYFDNFQNVVKAVMMFALQVAVLFSNLKLWYVGELTLGTFVLIQTYMVTIFLILWNLGRSLSKAVKSLTEMQEVIDIFDITPDILDPKKPEALKISVGRVVFDKVSFTYQGGVDVLEDFNLDISPGERVGLVGHSGAGKSTITKLLLRFTDIMKGDITIDGQNIKNITQNDLRSVISYIPQESILFHRTIGENIAYGRPDATQEEIIAVAKKAHADEFISQLPRGYDTLVGERGVKLSGGERQRVAIARAMLKNAPILVLDEATSSLDSVSESYIQDSFNELMKGKTTIIIAHRLSTIQKMDRIVVLEKGKIVEEGTHQELLGKKGVYAELWDHQTGGFLE